MDLVRTDFLRAESFRGPAVKSGETGHVIGVGLDGGVRVVANPQVLDEALAKGSHAIHLRRENEGWDTTPCPILPA